MCELFFIKKQENFRLSPAKSQRADSLEKYLALPSRKKRQFPTRALQMMWVVIFMIHSSRSNGRKKTWRSFGAPSKVICNKNCLWIESMENLTRLACVIALVIFMIGNKHSRHNLMTGYGSNSEFLRALRLRSVDWNHEVMEASNLSHFSLLFGFVQFLSSFKLFFLSTFLLSLTS